MIINLTPHPIRIRWADVREPIPHETDIVLEPQDEPARLATRSEYWADTHFPEDDYGGPGHQIPTYQVSHGEPENLPPPRPGVYLIVSLPMLLALGATRPDLRAPGTGPQDGAIRDTRGQIFAVTRLVKV